MVFSSLKAAIYKVHLSHNIFSEDFALLLQIWIVSQIADCFFLIESFSTSPHPLNIDRREELIKVLHFQIYWKCLRAPSLSKRKLRNTKHSTKQTFLSFRHFLNSDTLLSWNKEKESACQYRHANFAKQCQLSKKNSGAQTIFFSVYIAVCVLWTRICSRSTFLTESHYWLSIQHVGSNIRRVGYSSSGKLKNLTRRGQRISTSVC